MLCEAEGVRMHIFIYIHIPTKIHPFISYSFFASKHFFKLYTLKLNHWGCVY